MKKHFYYLIIIILLIFFNYALSAEEYSVAIFQLPASDSYVNMVKAIGEVTNKKFTIQLVPPGRGIYLIENGMIDAFFPATVSLDSNKISMMKYDYSTIKIYKMVFVLYLNKKNPIDIKQLKSGNPNNYKIETTPSLIQMFDFKPEQTTNIEGSLKKVNEGAIDGFLYAQEVSDPLLKKLGYKNIIRKLYSMNDIAFGIKKGTIGSDIDKTLIDGITKLKNSGRLNQILEFTLKNSNYSDWQP